MKVRTGCGERLRGWRWLVVHQDTSQETGRLPAGQGQMGEWAMVGGPLPEHHWMLLLDRPCLGGLLTPPRSAGPSPVAGG